MSAVTFPSTMSASLPVDFVSQTAIRRQLTRELLDLRVDITRSGLSDKMTVGLEKWHSDFSKALRSYRNENDVLTEYIGLLQDLLIDPMSLAPLDKRSVLGSDGHTYSGQTLDVHWHGTSPLRRERSPLDPENPTPFRTREHTVVRAMLGWLEKHGAMLHSRELQELAQQVILASPLPARETEESVRARATETRDRAAARNGVNKRTRISQQREIAARETGFLARMAALAASYDEPGVAQRAIERTAERNRSEAAVITADLEALAVRNQEGITEAHERLDEMGHVLDKVVQAQQAAELADRIGLEDLRRRIWGGVHTALNPQAAHIEAAEEAAAGEIEGLAQRDEVALGQLNMAAQQLRSGMVQLSADFEELEKNKSRLDTSISETKRESMALQQDIIQLRIEIQEEKENKLFKTIASVVVFGACAFTGYLAAGVAMKGAIAGSGYMALRKIDSET